MFRKFFNISYVIFFLLFFLTHTVNAQFTGLDGVELTITPDNPGPEEQVVATLNAYGVDINTLELSWILNGENVQSGKGLRIYSFKSGKLGSKNTLEVIGQKNGQIFSKRIIFSPAKVDILYEANSYTPPFYKGKPRLPFQGSLKLVAIPNILDASGKKVPDSKIIFKWKDGNQYLNNLSGYGKNNIAYKSDNDLPKTIEITVEASYPDNGAFASKTVSIEPIESKVVFYEEDPEYGLLTNKALEGSFTFDKEEAVISAMPVFFGVNNKNLSTLKYKWVLSDKSIENSDSAIILRNTSGKNGQANLSLQLSNDLDYFQSANNSLKIIFIKLNTLSR